MITGESLIVRTFRQGDIAPLFEMMSDLSDPGDFMPVQLYSEQQLMVEFQRNGCWQNTHGRLLITDLAGQIIGEAGLVCTRHYLDGREVYYRIFSDYRGRGYATEALALIISFFFNATSMNRIEAVTVVGNNASENVLLKNGFECEGTLRQARYLHGKRVDLKLFSLLRSDTSY